MSSFKINHAEIQRMSRELEREFAKHPVRVPIQADPQGSIWPLPSATTVNNYHGPVVTVNGDGAQLAWNSASIRQSHERVEQVAPGYENLALIIAGLLASVDQLSLNEADVEELRSNVNAVLEQVTTQEPDQGIIRRAVTMIKGLLAPVGVGVGDAVTDQSAKIASEVIGAIGRALPF